jgi:hypothetical protein
MEVLAERGAAVVDDMGPRAMADMAWWGGAPAPSPRWYTDIGSGVYGYTVKFIRI